MYGQKDAILLSPLEIEDEVFQLILSPLGWTCHELAEVSHAVLDVHSVLGNVQQSSQSGPETVLIPTCQHIFWSSFQIQLRALWVALPALWDKL